MRIKVTQLYTLFIIFLVVLITSCETRNDKLATTDGLVHQGKFEKAYDEIEKDKKKIYNLRRDFVLYYLDSGSLALYAQKYDTAIEELMTADMLMDEIRSKNFAEQFIASTVANDNVITYRGYNYEYVFTSLLLSLGYLSKNDFDDGFVEIRRSQDKLTKIQVDNKVLLSEYNKQQKNGYAKVKEINTPFVDSAFARMMEVWLYRADYDITNMEVSARKYQEAIVAQPNIYTFKPPEITDEQLDTRGNRVQVVALTDRAPILYSNRFSLNAVGGGLVIASYSEAMELPAGARPIDGGENAFFNGVGIIPLPGLGSTGFSIAFDVPAMAVFRGKVDRIEVWANNGKLGTLALTESLEQIAVESFKEESKFIYARQLTRVVTKAVAGITAQIAGDQLIGDGYGSLLSLGTQVAANVTEKADLRMTRYFPAKVWTGDFELPSSGRYDITLKYFNNSRQVKEITYPINITRENDNFNILMDIYL